MELKRYIEKDSKTALEKIRNLHGDDALIVSTEKVGNKTEVIVGVEETKSNILETPMLIERTPHQAQRRQLLPNWALVTLSQRRMPKEPVEIC